MLVGGRCEPAGPEPIPAGVCTGSPDQTYKGSSGYRKIPGNTCSGGLRKDEKVDRKCSQGRFICFSLALDINSWCPIFVAQPAEGEVIHQTVSLLAFESLILYPMLMVV